MLVFFVITLLFGVALIAFLIYKNIKDAGSNKTLIILSFVEPIFLIGLLALNFVVAIINIAFMTLCLIYCLFYYITNKNKISENELRHMGYKIIGCIFLLYLAISTFVFLPNILEVLALATA